MTGDAITRDAMTGDAMTGASATVPSGTNVSFPTTQLLSAEELAHSAASIASLQLESGLILWRVGGHADPWNHVETAMALDAQGWSDAARSAYKWLKNSQRADGSWHQYYDGSGVTDPKYDANVIAYVAVGAWHHFLTHGDEARLADQWEMVRNAIDWVLHLQQPTGEILWAREPDGTPFHYALITGSSSIHHSLGCAIQIAETLGHGVKRWAKAQSRVGHALAHHSLEFFAEKDRWAMDWYYPVLGGVLTGDAAGAQLKKRWDDFVIEGAGVRCVNDHPWVTTGETAEAAIACFKAGQHDAGRSLLEWTRVLRHDDGSYWTGLHVPTRAWYPEAERTAYSAAAVILAHACLDATTPTARTFQVPTQPPPQPPASRNRQP